MQTGRSDTFGTYAKNYMLEKVAEILTGEMKTIDGPALQWGRDHEDEACEEYEKRASVKVKHVGLVPYQGKNVNLKNWVGGSPDGLVGTDGMIEIKCPFNTQNHIATLRSLNVPTKYMGQVQGGMWLNNRKWCDFISYDPRIKEHDLKMVVIRAYRDDDYIALLEERIEMFLEEVDKILKEIRG